MPTEVGLIEFGLGIVFISMIVTRMYQRRAIEVHGVTAVRDAYTPGSGVVPAWVSLLNVGGWAVALPAGIWSIIAP